MRNRLSQGLRMHDRIVFDELFKVTLLVHNAVEVSVARIVNQATHLEVTGAILQRERLVDQSTERVLDLFQEPQPEPGGADPQAVEMLTELGVDRIWLLVADRSVVRWEGDRAASHGERLGRVAREATMQCRRAWLPEVRAGVAVADAAAEPGAALAQPTGAAPSLDRPTVLVGPEGGWSEGELASAPALVALGPTVLRSETAAVAAGSLLVALRAGLVAPGDRPGDA